MMTRVIQDSDDELEDDIEIDIPHLEEKDASSKISNSAASSTEALRRQIAAAHRAHLQVQFSMNSDQESVHLNANDQKRKLPVDSDSYKTSDEPSVSKKVAIAYIRTSMDNSSSIPAFQQQERSSMSHTSGIVTNRSDWVPGGTMFEAYAQHNPNEMFPEPSSTVPNATLTQQRVMEGVLPPALLGSDIDDVKASFQPDASIPWSEYLKSPTDPAEHLGAFAQDIKSDQISIAGPSTAEISARPGSQQSGQDLSMLGADQEATQQATSLSSLQESTRAKSLSSAKRSRREGPSPSPSPRLTSDDELADLSTPKEQHKARPSRSRSVKIGSQGPGVCVMRPEDTTKTSRRRKLTPATTVFADSQRTPDKIQRICEMGFTPSASARALRQNGGIVTQTVEWLVTNRIANDELVPHISPLPIIANNRTSAGFDTAKHTDSLQASQICAKKTGAKDTAAISDVKEHNMNSTESLSLAPIVDARSPVKVQVVIPARLPPNAVEATCAASHENASDLGTTSDRRGSTQMDTAVRCAKFEKKRSRGRPRKASNSTISSDFVRDKDEEDKGRQARKPLLAVENGKSQAPSTQHRVVTNTVISKVAKANHDPQVFQSRDVTNTPAIVQSTPEPPQLPGRPEVEPITPERTGRHLNQDQPSNKKGKVPYRVGLSKRARIAPLLRTVKK